MVSLKAVRHLHRPESTQKNQRQIDITASDHVCQSNALLAGREQAPQGKILCRAHTISH